MGRQTDIVTMPNDWDDDILPPSIVPNFRPVIMPEKRVMLEKLGLVGPAGESVFAQLRREAEEREWDRKVKAK